jgi:hypothetical protein
MAILLWPVVKNSRIHSLSEQFNDLELDFISLKVEIRLEVIVFTASQKSVITIKTMWVLFHLSTNRLSITAFVTQGVSHHDTYRLPHR